MKIPLLLSLLIFIQPSQDLPEYQIVEASHIYQGQTIIVKLKDPQPGLGVYAFERMYNFNEKGLAFVGVNVDTKPGPVTISLMDLSDPNNPQTIEGTSRQVRILPKNFSQWYAGNLRIRNEKELARRNQEIALMQKAYAQAQADSHADLTDGEYRKPMEDITITDEFGTIRLYGTYNRRRKRFNITERRPHKGVDIRAKTPLPVMAINRGRVLLATYLSSEGNIIILDHGSGVVSIYIHLSRINVNIGDIVTKGQLIALSGATPRGTPPHLHFMVKIQGTNVDPLDFIEKANRIY